jgi:hypothetical protein
VTAPEAFAAARRKKDDLDLIRLAEAYPRLKSRYPRELVEQIDRG